MISVPPVLRRFCHLVAAGFGCTLLPALAAGPPQGTEPSFVVRPLRSPSASRRIGFGYGAAAVRTRNSYRCSANWSGTIRRAARAPSRWTEAPHTRAVSACRTPVESLCAVRDCTPPARAIFGSSGASTLPRTGCSMHQLIMSRSSATRPPTVAETWGRFRDACWPRAGGTCRRTRRSRFRVHRRCGIPWSHTPRFYRFRFSKPAHPGASRPRRWTIARSRPVWSCPPALRPGAPPPPPSPSRCSDWTPSNWAISASEILWPSARVLGRVVRYLHRRLLSHNLTVLSPLVRVTEDCCAGGLWLSALAVSVAASSIIARKNGVLHGFAPVEFGQ